MKQGELLCTLRARYCSLPTALQGLGARQAGDAAKAAWPCSSSQLWGQNVLREGSQCDCLSGGTRQRDLAFFVTQLGLELCLGGTVEVRVLKEPGGGRLIF